MNELRIYRELEDYLGYDEVPLEMYDKDEVDKVIAELEMKLATVQQVLRLNEPEALFSNLETMDRLSHELGVVARRERYQKYKRCLAMAKYCEYRFMNLEKMIDTEYRTKKMRLSHRWWVKWLKLADKFKESKK